MVAQLRAFLGLALAGATELRLNHDVIECDVVEFERRIAAGNLEGAVSLYAGAFLDGVFLRHTSAFERWVDQERSRLQRLQEGALEQLGIRASATGDHLVAVRYWQQRASLSPDDSRVALNLMEAMVASGNRSGALAHYRVHQTLLQDDLGLEADATLARFAAGLRTATSRPTDASPHRSLQPANADAGAGAPSVPDANAPVQQDISIASGAAPPRPGVGRVWRRRSLILTLVVGAILALGVTEAWTARSGRFGRRAPAAPTHDSLRLRIVTTLVRSDPADSTLASGMRNAALAELAKDPWLFVVTPQAWVQQAPLIGLESAALSQPDTIRKYARKTRTHAIVDFGVSRVAAGFVITAEARGASSDSSLGVIAEAAPGPRELPDAMARLGRALRERLVDARSTLRPTKWSLNTTDQPAEAIALYVEARAEADRGNYIEATRRAALALVVDSTFAVAWRLRHSSLYNARLSIDDQLTAISAAFRFRGRVRSLLWRLDIASAYYRTIGDHERALVFSDSIARLAPPAPNLNAGLSYNMLRRHDLAVRGYQRYVDARPKEITPAHPNLVSSLLLAGRVQEAQGYVAEMMQADSTHERTALSRYSVFNALREWDSVSALGRSRLSLARTPMDSAVAFGWLANVAIVHGQFAAYDSLARLASSLVKEYASHGDFLSVQLQRAALRAIVTGDTIVARAIADSAFAIAPWRSLKPMDRPYLALLRYFASVRDTKRGAEIASEWSRTTPMEYRLRDSLNVLVGRAELALVSGKPREALRLFRIANVRDCAACFFPRLARTFDALNQRDSARFWFERYVHSTDPHNSVSDAAELGRTYLRLGEFSEARHDPTAAIGFYERLASLWAVSDSPALQARVVVMRERIARLRTTVGKGS